MPARQWLLVTGSPHADIGKGCLASVLGRVLARCTDSTFDVEYVKIEPCLQDHSQLASTLNTQFGEIVVRNDGLAVDADTQRAAFYIPSFRPKSDSHFSLLTLLTSVVSSAQGSRDSRRESQCLAEQVQVKFHWLAGTHEDNAVVFVVELGGTAGEEEHDRLCKVLARALGQPKLHVHLTTTLTPAQGSGRQETTKPAQTCIERLPLVPDVVLVRCHGVPAVETLRPCLPFDTLVLPVTHDAAWLERAYFRVLHRISSGFLAAVAKAMDLPLRGLQKGIDADQGLWRLDTGAARQLVLVDDGAWPSGGYASLAMRVAAWSQGALELIPSNSVSA